MRYLDGIPDFLDCAGTLSVKVCGAVAFVRCARFVARVCLRSARVVWVVERPPVQIPDATWRLPRRIDPFAPGADLWVGEPDGVLAELMPTERGGITVAGRHAATGARLWEHDVPIPDAAAWAEASPAWPGAQTEEIAPFLAHDPRRLVVGLARQTRRSMARTPGGEVAELPAYACQTDAVRLHPATGAAVWRAEFAGVPVGILERGAFSGLWSDRSRVGLVDLETGTNTVLHEFPHASGWPVRVGGEIAVSWCARGRVGVEWVDPAGRRVRSGSWRLPGVSRTYLHPTDAGLGVQTNDQGFWWLGDGCSPVWNVRAKPYIYRVHRAAGSAVFVGTDGNGGRLLGLDAGTGREVFNLKPRLGGVGHLTRLPGRDVLVSTFGVSRSPQAPVRLLTLDMRTCHHTLDGECFLLLGAWEWGAVCRAGRHGERLAVIDIGDAHALSA